VFIHGQVLGFELDGIDGAAVAGLELSEIAGTANAVSATAIETYLSRIDTGCLHILLECFVPVDGL
jgi:hypothetical protein